MKKADACRVIAVAATLIASSVGKAEWQPPENPSPSQILQEARTDASAGRSEDALAKYLWYHDNAVKYNRSQGSVRRSFALAYWYELGAIYPPALVKFSEARDKARKRVLESEHPQQAWDAFADFKAMSKKLEEEKAIAELFLELRDKNDKHAKKVYHLAQPALIDAGRFDICGEYLGGENAINGEIDRFKHTMKFVQQAEKRDGRPSRSFVASVERTFRRRAATTVAILVKNGNIDEAKIVSQRAHDAWDDKQLHELLEDALAGNLPKE
ncbi:hypothetical protein [Lacipirellula limnantheis]|uniref:Outer membrane protein assembly factor BamD n=1 Tax=Lacipirellula limnantheis TaxID=2528024 RepID=A0A517U1H1_9BACT|nr:hypothetical protein [Lacipirellula limnantheis]QDT74481.1 hypothetical protein I41_36780 [Lacipirellula limnantheis]